jgi:RNA polymerase sigma-70 factor, ECF subfamily
MLRGALALVARRRPAKEASVDRAFFDAIYRDHARYVWTTLRRLGVPDAERPDLVHDVFVVVWRRLGDYDRARPIKPWLFGIAYRVAADRRRRAATRYEQTTDAHDESAAPLTAADDVIDKKRARVVLDRALAAMDVEQRAVFILHDVDGESVAECARALEISANTLYSRLRIAREKLERAASAAFLSKEAG